jgi:hypothetical protein
MNRLAAAMTRAISPIVLTGVASAEWVADQADEQRRVHSYGTR